MDYYNRLFKFISPKTGKLARFTQLPNLNERDIIRGNSNNEPAATDDLTNLEIDFGDLQAFVNLMNLSLLEAQTEIELLKGTTLALTLKPYIIKSPDIFLPNSQSLFPLGNGVLKTSISGTTSGELSIASKDSEGADYVSYNHFAEKISKRPTSPDTTEINSIAVFDYTVDPDTQKVTERKIKQSKATADFLGNISSFSICVKEFATGMQTGFKMPSYLETPSIMYKMPVNAGMPTQVLATKSYLDSNQLYWYTPSTPPTDPDKPSPVFTPSPIPIPIGIPFPLPVFAPVPGVPLGGVVNTPVSVNPVTGDIKAPGNFDLDGNADFGGDVSSQGDLSTQGSINSEGNISSQGDISADGDISSFGDISADGDISGRSFRFDDLSSISDNFIEMEAPFDIDHNYSIELPDAEPFGDADIVAVSVGVQPPLARMGRSLNADPILPRAKLSWSTIEAVTPLKKTVIVDPTTKNKTIRLEVEGSVGLTESEEIELVYKVFTNSPAIFDGFVSSSRVNAVKIKTSFKENADYSSIASLNFLNRNDNGFCIENITENNKNPQLNINSLLNNNVTNIASFTTTDFIVKNNCFKLKNNEFTMGLNVANLTENQSLTFPTGAIGYLYNDGTNILKWQSVASGGVQSVTGTSGETTSTGGQNPVIGLSTILANAISSNKLLASLQVDQKGRITAVTESNLQVAGTTLSTTSNDLILNPVSTVKVNTDLYIMNGSTFRMYSSNNLYYFGLKVSASLATTTNYTVPSNMGINNQGLLTDGTGILSWGNVVRSITAGNGLSGGTITNTGTISLPTLGSTGTYTNANITIDAYGRITVASSGTTPPSVGNFSFSGNTISSNGDMTIGTNGSWINIDKNLVLKAPMYFTVGAAPLTIPSNTGVLWVNSAKKLVYSTSTNDYIIAG